MGGDLFYSCGCAGEGGGIFLCRETETAGKIETLALAPLPGANYHCFYGKFLYSTWNVAGKGGGAAAFRINEDNTLTELNRMESCGVATCHVTTSPDGAYLYAANYLTGTFAEFKLAADGSIAERTLVADHNSYPVGPRTDRQECAHTHCTRFTPDGKWLCVVDLGVDRVFLYPYQAGKGIDVDGVQIFVSDPGDGPRHIIFDAAGTTAYIVNELGNSVTCCSYSNGKLEALGKYTSLPENCTATTKAAAIRFSPDGDYERYTNQISFYALDGNRSYTDNIQLDFSVDPVDRFNITATFRYTNAKMELAGKGLVEKPMTSRFKGVLNLQYATNLNKWIFDFTASLNGSCRVYGFMKDFKDADGKLMYRNGRTPVYPMLYAQVTRRFKGWDVYIGAENLTNFRQKDAIIGYTRPGEDIIDPRYAQFDASCIWGPLMGIKAHVGFRFTLWK